MAVMMALAACSTGSSGAADGGATSDGSGTGSTTTADGSAQDPGDEAADDEGDAATASGPPAGDPPLASVASLQFLIAVAAGDEAGAESYLVPGAFDDPALGAPFDPAVLGARLPEVADLVASGELRPAPVGLAGADTSDPDAVGCLSEGGVVCAIDVIVAGAPRATVLVHWHRGGVSDVTVVARNADGDMAGIGRSLCSDGFRLVHGGQDPPRFDIAVCANDSGAAEYVGSDRSRSVGIRLDACAADATSWRADNGGTRYEVTASAEDPARSSIIVTTPDGTVNESGVFAGIEPAAAPTAAACP